MYQNGSNLRVAHCGGLTCTASTNVASVGAGASAPAFVSLAIGGDELPLLGLVTATCSAHIFHCSDTRCMPNNGPG